MSVGLLDFFILEASDYVERLDTVLAEAGDGGPDAAECTKLARGLRGSATMARVGGIADVAAAVERAFREVHAGRTAWSPALGGVLVGAVDDLKVLLHAVRSWGPEEDARSQSRVQSIVGSVSAARGPGATPSFASSGAGFVAARAAEIATALDALVAAPGDPAVAAELLRQVRALRGVAAVKDLPSVGEIVAAVERAAQPLELGEGSVTPQRRAVFTAAAALLRKAAEGAGAVADVGGQEATQFAEAVAALDGDAQPEGNRIVPIAELAPDGGDSIVVRSPNPPTTPARRFGLEVVSQAEHLRRLRADALAATDPIGRERVGQELRRALRALHDSAVSFGEHAVARVATELGAAAAALAPALLDTVERLASVLASPTDSPDERARHVGVLRAPEGVAGSEAAAPSPTSAPMPAAAATAPSSPATESPDAASAEAPLRAVSQTPTGPELHALLEDSLAGISRLDRQPLGDAERAEPADGGEQADPVAEAATEGGGAGAPELVPIETLLYRGPSALRRAREIRDELRAASGGRRLPDALAELFELLDLAAAE